jgi:hypothetical protein
MRNATKSGRDLQIVLACVSAITLVRIILLMVSPLELHPDEAQYWWWAQTPSFGYYSKPPMIAWIIWGETSLLGSAEWAIRLASPLLHGLTSLVVFAVGRHVYGSRIGLLSALAYLTTPGASYSSVLFSTDVPLLLFWAVGLYAFLCAMDDRSWRWPVLCGAAIGLGLLSKYAMLYFILGAVAAAVISPKARGVVFGPRGCIAIAVGLLLIAPNLWWNARHGFATVTHVATNAEWGRSRFAASGMAAFFLGQFGVFGPVLMAGYLAALWRLARGAGRNQQALCLAAFSALPLALMLAQSFIVTANANWAATAYVAAAPLAVWELIGWWNARGLWASFAINVFVMLVLWIVLARPEAADRLGIGNAFKREEGWRPLGRQVALEAEKGHFDAIATDNRSTMAELLYYARPCSVPIRSLGSDAGPRNQFEMTLPLTPGTARVLLAIVPQGARGAAARFDSTSLLSNIVIPVGGHRQRVTQLYDARVYRGP